jgi:hypothetical protein
MNKALDCPATSSNLSVSLLRLLGRIWRSLTHTNRLNPDALSAHMLCDLGLPAHTAEDLLARERLRGFF